MLASACHLLHQCEHLRMYCIHPQPPLERVCDSENVPSVSSINRIVRNKSSMDRLSERTLQQTAFLAPTTPYSINELLGFEQPSK
ncbi:hypothetical protein WUBG_12967, partial [Wuchereria bancrofti]